CVRDSRTYSRGGWAGRHFDYW
nr:immunoglobulin heavy chain junction region [Macaca mulatta]MOV48786.1 immunoglobulin heavy chain junction region [Macaca mulatta]MOV48861.1 immunoglobulin heavy chain junction region [Macaca mulatta]MOV48931.1 immunoglobulin heavy chain junction region [Macaca mulatta]MOV49011.1 immunoglobulin heavy chain junction region [Macaca mulatta]